MNEVDEVESGPHVAEASAPSVGVYVHVPFCERICPYCDFAVVKAEGLPAEREARYVDALLLELEQRAADFSERRLASVYLGGGTPSLLTPASIERIVNAVRCAFPDTADASEARSAGEPEGLARRVGEQAGFARRYPAKSASEAREGMGELEITLEVNPSTLERERLPGFYSAGVNRLSIGVQSFDDRVLKRLGRAHRAEEARRTLAAARSAGFANVSLDFIYAAPEQTLAMLERDLAEAIAFAPEHVSAYELTIEAETPFATAAARGQLRLPDEDLALAMAESVEARLGEAGLRRYEISSYARSGREALHNRRYWQRRPVLGLGVSAVSSNPPASSAPFGSRLANRRALPAYPEA